MRGGCFRVEDMANLKHKIFHPGEGSTYSQKVLLSNINFFFQLQIKVFLKYFKSLGVTQGDFFLQNNVFKDTYWHKTIKVDILTRGGV